MCFPVLRKAFAIANAGFYRCLNQDFSNTLRFDVIGLLRQKNACTPSETPDIELPRGGPAIIESMANIRERVHARHTGERHGTSITRVLPDRSVPHERVKCPSLY